MFTIQDISINEKEARKRMMKDLVELIDRVPDDDSPSAIKHLIAYLNGLLRIKSITPPTTEIISLIKYQKPRLYQATKRSITSTSHLNMLFLIDMDPVLASNRLQQFVKS